MDMRAVEEKKLKNNPNFTIGDVTTVNLTMVTGGVQDNVVPPVIDVGFDIRVALDLDHKVLESRVSVNNNCLKKDIVIFFSLSNGARKLAVVLKFGSGKRNLWWKPQRLMLVTLIGLLLNRRLMICNIFTYSQFFGHI